LLKVLKQPQEVLRYGLSRDFIEYGTNMAADMSLEGRGEAVVRAHPLRLAWHGGGVIVHCLIHSFVYAWHLSPAVLLSSVAVHDRSPDPRLVLKP
jgi:hypothetical protein